jgi:hypothetical protein
MKKLLLLIGIYGVSVCVNAQGTLPSHSNATKPTRTQNLHFDASKLKAKQAKAADRTAATTWLSYALTMDSYNGGGSTGPAVLNSNYLFPDSTVQGEFGTGNFSSVWLHHIGDVLDVKSGYFNVVDGLDWTAADAYQVDSMSIVYAYMRNLTEIDTLVVTLETNVILSGTTNNFYSSGFLAPTATDYGTDTLGFKTLRYDQVNNVANATGKYTFKIPLDDADSDPTNYIEKAFALPIPFDVAAGKLLGCDIMFKPGYTWNSEDHVDDLNAFFFASYEENGDGTFPTYTDCNYQSAACDYNSSSTVPQDVRYNTAGTWNGKFIPSYAYPDAGSYEHHLISYRVTNPIPLSVKENAGNDFALNQNQPNPFKDQTTINYQLKKGADNVSIQIYDVTGVKLFEKNESNAKAGSYSVEVNTSDFAAGLYFYSITVDGAKVTKKMIAE